MNDLESWGAGLGPEVAPYVAAVEGAVEALTALSGGIAHDFSNVFQALVFALQATLAEAPEGSELRAQLNDVRAGSDRGVRLLRSLARLGARPSTSRQIVFPHDAVPALAPNLRRALALAEPMEVDVDGVSAPIQINPAVLDGALLTACVAVHHHGAGPVGIKVRDGDSGISIVVTGAGTGPLDALTAVFADRPPVVGPRVTTFCARVREAGGAIRVARDAEGRATVVIELPAYVAPARG